MTNLRNGDEELLSVAGGGRVPVAGKTLELRAHAEISGPAEIVSGVTTKHKSPTDSTRLWSNVENK